MDFSLSRHQSQEQLAKGKCVGITDCANTVRTKLENTINGGGEFQNVKIVVG